jgi:hypothetical protein
MYEIAKQGFWWVLEITENSSNDKFSSYDLIELLRWQLRDYPGCKRMSYDRWHFRDYPTGAEHIITLLLLKNA